MPKFYIKTMVELEDHLADSLQKDKANKKKSSGNSKAMNNLKQKLRKLAKQFDQSITAYRKVSKKKFNNKKNFRAIANANWQNVES